MTEFENADITLTRMLDAAGASGHGINISDKKMLELQTHSHR